MTSGKLSKNLTDAFKLIMALLALISVVSAYVSFEDGYIMEHPYTGEEIDVTSLFQDPVVTFQALLGVCFLVSAFVSYVTRHHFPVLSLFFDVALVVLALVGYHRRLIDQMDFMYIFFTFFGLAGSIVYTACYYVEKKADPEPSGLEAEKSESPELSE